MMNYLSSANDVINQRMLFISFSLHNEYARFYSEEGNNLTAYIRISKKGKLLKDSIFECDAHNTFQVFLTLITEAHFRLNSVNSTFGQTFEDMEYF